MPLEPASWLQTAPVDHIISLGASCETAYNLRRHFQFATAYPFDWWVSSLHGVTGFLDARDPLALYAPENLARRQDGSTVDNLAFGIALHHEFPRDWKQPGHPVKADFLSGLHAPRQRTAHLAERFFALDTERTRLLFVRQMALADASDKALDMLLDVLRKRFVRARFSLALVDPPAAVSIPPECAAVYARSSSRMGWKGDPQRWDAALASLRTTLAPGVHQPPTAADLRAQANAIRITAGTHTIA